VQLEHEVQLWHLVQSDNSIQLPASLEMACGLKDLQRTFAVVAAVAFTKC
jgi:hypothetical protein